MRTSSTRRRAAAAALAVLVGLAASALAVAQSVCELHGSDRAHASIGKCAVCHDGSAGPGVFFGQGHPVDVPYASSWSRPLVPSAMLPREIVLVSGRVECTSCHDGASKAAHHLALPGRDLCLACHRM